MQELSVLGALAGSSVIIMGLLRFLSNYARSSNADYQALSKTLDRERQAKLEVMADRDAWKLRAMKYADQRDQAMRYATHWRDEFKRVTQQPPLKPVSTPIDPSSSGIMQIDLEVMKAEVRLEDK